MIRPHAADTLVSLRHVWRYPIEKCTAIVIFTTWRQKVGQRETVHSYIRKIYVSLSQVSCFEHLNHATFGFETDEVHSREHFLRPSKHQPQKSTFPDSSLFSSVLHSRGDVRARNMHDTIQASQNASDMDSRGSG